MNVVITGTSSGFGKITSKHLARAGHTVFATMRGVTGKNAPAAEELRAFAEKERVALHVLELDVTSDASVAEAVAHIEASGPIDVVINNAGFGYFGHGESISAEQLAHQLDVNVVGVQRVNRAVLPGMRARRSGLLVHVTSGLGRIVLPTLGVYGASKFALEALAEAYRYELAALGIDSVIVQPGAFATGFFGNVPGVASPERGSAYGEAADLGKKLGDAMHGMTTSKDAPDPVLIAEAIANLIATPTGSRPLRTVVDPLTGQGTATINGVASEVQRGVFDAMGLSAVLEPRAS
jgi:NAD(P)-dependent dehydrogenase (short-subunit alcohol dehydrogenase family)